MASGLEDAEVIGVQCVICRVGETTAGTATVTLERDSLTLVVKGVPALVCANCGEEYVDEATATGLLATAEEAAKGGVQVEIREFVAA